MSTTKSVIERNRFGQLQMRLGGVLAALAVLGLEACDSSPGAFGKKVADGGVDSGMAEMTAPDLNRSQEVGGLDFGRPVGEDGSERKEAGTGGAGGSAGTSGGSGGSMGLIDASGGAGGAEDVGVGGGSDTGGSLGLDGRPSESETGDGPSPIGAGIDVPMANEVPPQNDSGAVEGGSVLPMADAGSDATDSPGVSPPISDAADGGRDAGSDRAADGGGDSAAGDASVDRVDGVGDGPGGDAGGGDGSRTDGSADGGSDGPCCGCLCRDPSWSCSTETCLDPTGRAIALTAEAGFFELAGGNYVSEGQARVSPIQRIWYSFQPATSAPQSKPLAVFFNGGPGAGTSPYLFAFNTAPYTLDPAATGTGSIAINPNSWTQFANLLYIDAPGTGFSYPMSLETGAKPSVGIDLDRDAASVIRVIVRFLDRHPPLQSNRVLLVGESYGGTRSTLMLDRLLNYQTLPNPGALYQDSGLYSDLIAHFSAVFPASNPATLSATQVATQFSHQVLIQPVVAGSSQWDLNYKEDTSVCLSSAYDSYQCDKASNWSTDGATTAANRLTGMATLRQALGIDPTTIAWMYASARTRAYGRGTGTIASAPEMTATFGTLGSDDNYLVMINSAIGRGYDSGSRWWTDPNIGTSFLDDVIYVNTFITNARFDMVVWSPAIPESLNLYTSLVSSSVHDTAARTGFTRAGWIKVNYLSSVISAPTDREIRFPLYQAGHTVTMRAPAELLADVTQWHANTLASPVAHRGPSEGTAAVGAGSSTERFSPAPTTTASVPKPYLGP
jgi:hypothetical protein